MVSQDLSLDKLTGDFETVTGWILLSLAGYVVVRWFWRLLEADKWINESADWVRNTLLNLVGA